MQRERDKLSRIQLVTGCVRKRKKTRERQKEKERRKEREKEREGGDKLSLIEGLTE